MGTISNGKHIPPIPSSRPVYPNPLWDNVVLALKGHYAIEGVDTYEIIRRIVLTDLGYEKITDKDLLRVLVILSQGAYRRWTMSFRGTQQAMERLFEVLLGEVDQDKSPLQKVLDHHLGFVTTADLRTVYGENHNDQWPSVNGKLYRSLRDFFEPSPSTRGS